MNAKYISYALLLFFLIEKVASQGPRISRKLPGPKHPNDELFFEMEKQGKKPKDLNLKFEDRNNPNLIVDVEEIKDHDYNKDVITNKSKLRITWSVNNDTPPVNNINNQPPPSTTFTIKLLSNVTQDSISKLFYPLDEKQIETNLSTYEYEYKIPKLDENYVYNIAVIGDSIGSKNNSIGLSRTLIYKPYEKPTKPKNEDKQDNPNEGSSNGINPLVYVGIVVGGVAIVGIAYLISKKISKDDSNDDNDDNDDNYNLPVQIPNSSKDNDLRGDELDHISIASNDTGEVSWSNLEIAQTSQQTKNEANEHVYRTLDRKGYKRDDKNKEKAYETNEIQLYKVVRMFMPTESDEIQLNIGDDVEITTIFEDGWCEGINKSINKSGIFPRTCVIEAEEYASMIEKSKVSSLPSRKRSRKNKNQYNQNIYNPNQNNAIPETDYQQQQ